MYKGEIVLGYELVYECYDYLYHKVVINLNTNSVYEGDKLLIWYCEQDCTGKYIKLYKELEVDN